MDKIKNYLRQQAEIYGLRPRFVEAIEAIGTDTALDVRSGLFGYATEGRGVDARRARRVEMMIEDVLQIAALPDGIAERAAARALAHEAGLIAGDAARAMGRDLDVCQDRASAARDRVIALLAS
jgi:hypothetical protein